MANQSPRPVKAELHELDAKLEKAVNPERTVKVQFNPETLKVAFSNTLEQPSGSGDQRGSPPQRFVGAGTTKLTCQLTFDVTQEQPAGAQAVDDVRKLTQKVAYFITPRMSKGKFVAPAVRFIWGTFQFDGVMESMEESLEFFSPEGKPLRATVSLGLSQQKITDYAFAKAEDASSKAPPTAGTRPYTEAPAGATVQSLAAAQGAGADWQAIAAANGIENPRLLQPGQLLDLGAAVGAGAGAAVGASASLGVGGTADLGLDAGAGLSADVGGGLGIGASASASVGLSAGVSASAGGSFGADAGASASAGASGSAGGVG